MKRLTLAILALLVTCFALSLNAKENTKTPELIEAVLYDDLETFAELVNAGTNIEVKDKDGQTPLIVAAKDGSVLMTNLLLQLGANVNTKDKGGHTAADWAKFGEKDPQKGYDNHKKNQLIEGYIKKPAVKKKYQRVLTDGDTAIILKCDNMIITENLTACQKKDSWEINENNGDYFDAAKEVELVSDKNKKYLILEKWGQYSIISGSGETLKEKLKQAKYRKTDSGIAFDIVNSEGKSSTFTPNK